MGEDGTPFVTFPRNFDRVVGLMGRQDLDGPPQLQRENTTKHGASVVGGSGGGNAVREKTQKVSPPWTKYLLEEGLDCTKTFSRYRGMFAGGAIEAHYTIYATGRGTKLLTPR